MHVCPASSDALLSATALYAMRRAERCQRRGKTKTRENASPSRGSKLGQLVLVKAVLHSLLQTHALELESKGLLSPNCFYSRLGDSTRSDERTMLRLPTLLASALSLVLALAFAGSAAAQTNNVTSLYGTWTSGTGAVVTGPVSRVFPRALTMRPRLTRRSPAGLCRPDEQRPAVHLSRQHGHRLLVHRRRLL